MFFFLLKKKECPCPSPLFVAAHNMAFRYFGGRTTEIVYDQDRVMAVLENAGDLMLTEVFETYARYMDGLLHILKTCEISQKSQARLRWIKKCQLLTIDELGYPPVSWGEANFLFSFISELYENTSIVLTSNKGFDGWAEILGDAVLATALLDRLTHRCQILNFSDEGYRLANRNQIFNY